MPCDGRGALRGEERTLYRPERGQNKKVERGRAVSGSLRFVAERNNNEQNIQAVKRGGRA